ncbi:glycosyltransferase [Aquimarina sp. 2201CG14-23]|uniref:glycosyltransferase n=1 Tax=Aquimarina mycalae TaxID=3040073 RepID=UPI0024782AEC|nr:glycosyltransferase [Aquimarina sp. 2201CG14-23]MDH7448047.1 glycosyltransferase [Aquimarina sp. 2201CG14-23]
MNKNISHIVFLTPGFPGSDKDSTTIPALQSYLKSLRKVVPNTKITLLTFQFPFSNKTYNWNGIQVISLNGKNQRYRKLWVWNKALKKLKKLHQESPITTLHSFWIGECSFIGQKFSAKRNIPHIITAMGQDIYKNNRYVISLIGSNAKIITLSKNHSNALLKNHQLQSTIIPWGLNTSVFPELRQNKIDILGVGSLNIIKNYTVFITVIAKLIKKHPKLKVEIIGPGKKPEQVLKMISKFQLENTISFTGILKRDLVLEKMSQSKILLHTSTYESYGYVFAEALYSGMSIVSNNVGIAQEKKEWNICQSEEEMVTACDIILSSLDTEKKRILLHSEKETLNSYLKLYNA